MNEIKKVVGINLIVILVYSLLIRESGNSDYHDQAGILFGMAVFVTLHVILNIILSLIFSLYPHEPNNSTMKLI